MPGCPENARKTHEFDFRACPPADSEKPEGKEIFMAGKTETHHQRYPEEITM
jgi:hypothetical protein